MKRVSSAALGCIVVLGGGCPRTGGSLSGYTGTKWEGYVDVTAACEHGGYTGGDLKICAIFDETAGGLLSAHLDWDPTQLREDCGYFPFVGREDAAGLQLVRWEDGERDDLLVLARHGDSLTGTLQVHPSCARWPVQMNRVPQPPDADVSPRSPAELPL
jgi:hypothetical protein